ncbi:MAG: RNA polymerase sigma factor [Planctomycetota bacterium]
MITVERFAVLYQQAFGWLCLVAAAHAGRTDADDIVQQAAIVAMKRLGDFRAETSFRAWMAAIVRNTAKNQARSNRRRKKRERKVASHQRIDQQETLPGSTPSAMDTKLRDAVNGLEDSQRSCLLMRSAYGLSYAEIGAALDLPEATARSHVFRARKQLLEKVRVESLEASV